MFTPLPKEDITRSHGVEMNKKECTLYKCLLFHFNENAKRDLNTSRNKTPFWLNEYGNFTMNEYVKLKLFELKLYFFGKITEIFLF